MTVVDQSDADDSAAGLHNSGFLFSNHGVGTGCLWFEPACAVDG